jgi:hypothetical protein
MLSGHSAENGDEPEENALGRLKKDEITEDRLEFECRDGGNPGGEAEGMFKLLMRGEGLDLGSEFSGHETERFVFTSMWRISFESSIWNPAAE